MVTRKALVAAGLLVLAVLSFAAVMTGGNLLVGTDAWKSVRLIPDPAWTGAGQTQADRECSVSNGPNGRIWIECFAIPDAATGYWNAVVRLRPRTGATYGYGHEIGVEGTYDAATGTETVNRFYVWDFTPRPGNPNGRTILFHDQQNPTLLVVGGEEPVGVYATGSVQAVGGYKASTGETGLTTSGPNCPGKFKNGLCVASGGK